MSSDSDSGWDESDVDHNFEERVGYCSPPKGSRFEPGVSGNPAGRPPKQHSRKAKVERTARRRVPIRVGGRAVSMTALGAIVYIIKLQAIAGKADAIKLREKLLGIYEPDDPNPIPQGYLIRRAPMSEEEWWARYGHLGDDPTINRSDSTASPRSE